MLPTSVVRKMIDLKKNQVETELESSSDVETWLILPLRVEPPTATSFGKTHSPGTSTGSSGILIPKSRRL